MRYTRKRIEGSNPPLSAYKKIKLSVQVYLSKQFLFFYMQGCHRQTWVFEVGEQSEVGALESLLIIKLSVQVYLSKQFFIFLYARMPSADLGIRGGRAKRGRCPRIPNDNKTVCPSLLEQAVFFYMQGCHRQTCYGFRILPKTFNAPAMVLTCWMVA